MRRFKLKRVVDVSGISGTGIIAEGIMFSNGRCVLQWLGLWPSIVIWASVDDMLHVNGHGGNTVIDWIDDVNYINIYGNDE